LRDLYADKLSVCNCLCSCWLANHNALRWHRLADSEFRLTYFVWTIKICKIFGPVSFFLIFINLSLLKDLKKCFLKILQKYFQENFLKLCWVEFFRLIHIISVIFLNQRSKNNVSFVTLFVTFVTFVSFSHICSFFTDALKWQYNQIWRSI
jgi:hypothetical protein